MTRFLTVCSIGFGCFSFLPSALGWGAEGHMVVSQIAYSHLAPAVKAKCDALIAVPMTYQDSRSTNFVTAAVWADDFKTQLGTAIWHYIDLPFSPDNSPLTNFVPDSFDVVQAINLCVSNLASAATTETDKATSLRYLLHFVGDIQQPLHCSTAITESRLTGDRGGNDFLLSGNPGNLHSLWDSGGGFVGASISRPLTASGISTLSNRAFIVEALYPYAPTNGIQNPMDWAQEGLGLAQTVCYVGITEGSTASSAYTNSAQAITKQRMAAGGHRLADLLNTILTTNAMPLACSPSSNGQLSFSWSAVPGRNYRVQWKPELTNAAWFDLTNVIALSNAVVFSDSVGPAHRFYRVAQ
jgi:hypothetical protein